MSDASNNRVLHVITGLGNGGAEGVLARLTCASRPAPVQSLVISLTPGGDSREVLEEQGVDVCDLGMCRGVPDPRAVMRLAAIFKQVRPAAIQSWMYHADLLSLAALKLSGALHNTRLYWGVRCSDMQGKHYGCGFRAVRKLCAMLSGRPTGIVANSFAGREVHVRRGYAAPNFMVIPNGIDVDRFSPNPIRREALRQQLGLAASDVVAFTAARVDPMKGYELVKLAATALPDLRFVIAGTGTEELSLPANVTALGHRTDLPDLLPVADILLSPSLFGEGFSNSIAEGMAVALCPVVSDVGDARLIAGGCGEVFKPGDVHSLASILRRLVDGGSDALSERGRMARERITAQFSMAEMVRSFDALHLHGEQPLRSA